MYKNTYINDSVNDLPYVSILVLMDLCIKTVDEEGNQFVFEAFQSLF